MNTVLDNNFLLSEALHQYPGFILIKDSKLKIVYISHEFKNYLGIDEKYIIGKKENEVFGVSNDGYDTIEKEILATGRVYLNTHFIDYEYQKNHFRVTKFRIEIEQNFFIIVIADKYNDEFQRNLELQKNEIYLRTLVDYSDSVMAVLNKQGSINNFFGSEKLINNPSTAFKILISEIIDQLSLKQIVKNIEYVCKTKSEYSVKKSLTYKGEKFFLKDSYYPILNDQGEVSEVGIIRQDVTYVREIQEAYTNLVNNSSLGLLIIQNDFVAFCNYRLAEILGVNTNEIEKQNVIQLLNQFVPEVYINIVLEKYYEIITNQIRNRSFELNLKTRSGKIIWVEFMWNRILYNGSHAIQAAMFDITERKSAVRSLEKFKLMVNTLNEGILFINKEKKITVVNNHLLDILKMDEKSILNSTLDIILGKKLYDIISPTLFFECFMKGKFYSTEEWVSLPAGDRYLEISINPYYEDSEKISGAVIVLYDLTETIQTHIKMNEIAQNERRKIAMELHDGLTHELLGISINTKLLYNSIEINADIDEYKNKLLDIKNDLNSAISTARYLSKGISPIHEQYTSIEKMLTDLIMIVEKRYNITCKLQLESDIKLEDDYILEHLYYIIEESISNSVKHANAETIEIDVYKENDFLFIKVRDFGKGFNLSSIHDGLGLKFMKIRSRAINSSFDITSNKDIGTVVFCKLKLPS
jgi:PAS domain S-box-containing protein